MQNKNKCCITCVKLRCNENGNPECAALNELIGKNGNCWAYSDDPEFWVKFQEASRQYALNHGGE